jgi:hypothetical protein
MLHHSKCAVVHSAPFWAGSTSRWHSDVSPSGGLWAILLHLHALPLAKKQWSRMWNIFLEASNSVQLWANNDTLFMAVMVCMSSIAEHKISGKFGPQTERMYQKCFFWKMEESKHRQPLVLRKTMSHDSFFFARTRLFQRNQLYVNGPYLEATVTILGKQRKSHWLWDEKHTKQVTFRPNRGHHANFQANSRQKQLCLEFFEHFGKLSQSLSWNTR